MKNDWVPLNDCLFCGLPAKMRIDDDKGTLEIMGCEHTRSKTEAIVVTLLQGVKEKETEKEKGD